MAYIPIDFGNSPQTSPTSPNSPTPTPKTSGYIPIDFGGAGEVKSATTPSTYKPFTGGGYFPATNFSKGLTDRASGRPYQGVTLNIPKSAINPEYNIPTIDSTRVASGFDPTKPMPSQIPKEVLENPGISASIRAAIKNAMNGNSTDELDHIMALGLGGSNAKSNLRIQPGRKGGAAATSDKLEANLISKVKSGQMTLRDAQNQLAQSKGKTLAENLGQRSKTDQWLMDHPDVLTPLANLQSTIENIAKGIKGNIKGILPPFLGGNKQNDIVQPISDAWNNLKESGAKAVVSFTSKQRPTSEKIGATANLLASSANAIFTPISMVFNTLKDIPVVGSLSQIATLPFSIVGAGGEIIGKEAIDSLPISEQAKNNLRDAAGQIGSLAGQIALGAGMSKATAVKVIKDTAQQTADAIKDGKNITPDTVKTTLANNIEKAKTEPTTETPKGNGTTLKSNAIPKGQEAPYNEAKKYKSAGDFAMAQAKQEYRSAHQLSLSDSITPDKIDIPTLKEQIRTRNGYLDNYTLANLKKLKKLQNNPEADITIYRASPKNAINEGDWVTTDKTYANYIKKLNGGKVYSYVVKVKDLRFPKDTETLPSLSMASTFSYAPKMSQLTDIWNKANKETPKEAPIGIKPNETQPTILKGNTETPVSTSATTPNPTTEATNLSRSGAVNFGEGIEGLKQNINSVKDYIAERSQQQELGTNISDNYYKSITNGKKIDDIVSRRILDNVNISPEDQKAIYNWMENPKEPITPEQLKSYNENIRPLVEGSTKLYNEIKGKGIPLPTEDSPMHATRSVVGRGSFLDRLASGFKGTRMGGLLGKSAGFLKKRTMMAIEDESGDRVIVSIKDGKVTGFDKGEMFDMGKLKTSDYQALADKEMKPFQNKLESLQKEKDILTATKGRAEASPTRLANIDTQMTKLTNQIADIENKYNTGLEGKVFVDSKGKAWKIADATTKEIEANTNVKYYKAPLITELQRFNKLNQIKRATDFLESTKSSLEEGEMIKKIGSYDMPEKWTTTELPQFRGYMMPKRMANVLDTLYDQVKKGNPGALTKINLFLRTTIFFNPLIHIPNILNHWVVARGWQWANPLAYPRMVKAGARAIKAVLTMNDDYVNALNEGSPLLYSEVKNADLYKSYLAKMSYDIPSDPKMFDMIKNSFGLDNPTVQKVLDSINPYKVSGKTTWAVNDILTLQSIFEEVNRGKTMTEAIADVGKHIPNYRMPAELLGSKQFMDAIKNPNLTMFSAYHYGALRSYFEMAKSLVAGESISERTDAIGKILMIGLTTFVLYPELDKLTKQVTGNPNATVRRAGASTFPYNTMKLIQGKEDFTSYLTSIITPSVIASVPLDIAQGYLKTPNLTEIKANPVGSATQLGTDLASNLISPLGYASNVLSGKKTIGNTLLQFVGISTPKSTPSQQGVYDIIHNQRPTILTKIKSLISSGDTDSAKNLIKTYNDNLKNMFIGTLTDRGYSQSDAENTFNQWMNSKSSKVSSYFIKGITQKQMKNYQTKKSRTSFQNLIMK